MEALIAILAIFLGWALVAGRLARWSITAPIAMVLAGVVLTGGSDPVFNLDLDRASLERGVEVVLAIVLFIDATEVPGGILGREPRVTLRLLGIALPLSLLLALVIAVGLFPSEDVWVLAVLATIVCPIDLAPVVAMMRDSRVPSRLREILNVESGLNDGLIAPLFLFCIAGAEAAGGSAVVDALLKALPAMLVALGVGAAVGHASARLLGGAAARGWTQPSALRLGVLALPLLAYAVAVVLDGNGFVAAFVAGVLFGPAARRLPHDALRLTEDTAELLSLILWFVFGRLVNEALEGGIDLAAVLYALLAITVVRILPVALSLRGSGISGRDTLFLGWFGPRGLATIVFGLLAFIDLDAPADDIVNDVMVLTVLISVLLHGLSAGPIAAAYARHAERELAEGAEPAAGRGEPERVPS